MEGEVLVCMLKLGHAPLGKFLNLQPLRLLSETIIIESVDSISRDGPDTPYT